MSKINPYIEFYTPDDYGDVDGSKVTLNCALGVNPKPLPEIITEVMNSLTLHDVHDYPHDETVMDNLRQGLLERYLPIAPDLTPEQLVFGCGSLNLMANLNNMYANPSSKVMGLAPQFTWYVAEVHFTGAQWVGYPLDKTNNYKLDIQGFAQAIRAEKPALICCENPNNPTGQALVKEDIMTLIDAAKDVDAAILFDEAYGEYLPMEQSAISCIAYGEEQGVDVYVTRSFSKGFGMAGLRMGYAVGPKYGSTHLAKITNPFYCSGISRRVASVAVNHELSHLHHLRRKTKATNTELYEKIRALGKYEIAHTSLYSPIFTLYVKDESVDLAQALLDVGIATVPGATFENLGKNAVRIMLCEDVALLVDLLAQANV